jgi:hypothetical protein
MGKIFTVTKSFVEGERHVAMARPLELRDFRFDINPYESTSQSVGIRVGINVEGTLDPAILAEVKEVFPADEMHMGFNRYHREKREALATGTVRRSKGVEADYRGCRSEESCRAKAERMLPGMREKANGMAWEARHEIVQVANDMLQSLMNDLNRRYTESAIQNLTREWEGIHQEAGTAGKVAEAIALRKRAAAIDNEVKASLNAWMLKDMEESGWKVNDEPLAQPVIDALRDRYSKGEAFASRHLF